jgi:translation initiation factor 4A
MLDRGFQNQIHEIFTMGIPSDTQIALFSATWTDEAQIIAQKFMRNPKIIEVKKENTTLDGIKQYKIDVGRDENKFDTLVDLYKAISIKQAIIYCNTKKRVDEISYKLKEREMSVSSMHSEMNQNDRNKIMKNFRAGASRILLSTDLNARGIDIQQVSLVINYDIPNNKENYIHRIGRSGRFGRKGIALNFVSDKEKAALDEIETYYKTVVEDLPANIEQVMSY